MAEVSPSRWAVMRLRTPIAFLVTLGVLGGGLVLGIESALIAYGAGRGVYDGLDTLARALSHVEENYAEEVDFEELVYSAIDGIAASLDKHSHFFDPEEFKRLMEDNDGNYFGVGVEVRPHPDGGLKVVGIIPGGPAEAVQMQVDDHIISVDGESVIGESFEATVTKIRGPRGEAVTLGIVRAGQSMDVTVIRDAVHTASVRSEWLGEGVAYVYLSQFQKRSTDELNQHLHDLKSASKGTLRALILDMRMNPGGLLNEAVSTVDLFVKEGTIVTTVGRSEFAMETFSARPGADLSEGHLTEEEAWEDGLALIILIDGESASAAEIVAGALQDLGRATIVGEKSYGKGSVQSIFEYGDHTALKLTIGRYHLPSGRSIEVDGGVEPDIVVPYDSGENAADTLRKEMMSLELSWEQYEHLDSLLNELHPHREEPIPHRFRDPVKERLAWDAQLAKALELARQASP
jgi:carboxyl-terminal processing protease